MWYKLIEYDDDNNNDTNYNNDADNTGDIYCNIIPIELEGNIMLCNSQCCIAPGDRASKLSCDLRVVSATLELYSLRRGLYRAVSRITQFRYRECKIETLTEQV